MNKVTDRLLSIKKRFYVISGGPGAGKTTLINELKASGNLCVHEVGRQVIQDQLKAGGNGLPWIDLAMYTSLMLEMSLRTYMQALENTDAITFFDRGIPDSIAYARLANHTIPAELDEAARIYRYNNPVFMLPPWPEIYIQDEERREGFSDSVKIYEMLRMVFTDYGYTLVDVPNLPVAERAQYILDYIKQYPA